ncbi:hypothetical protein HK101_007849 [Irineochytrium annulatum]|nr:hypothetical protein HK101_007849 [Irineochytrium annulatum]
MSREAVFKSGTIVGIPRVINSLTSFRSVLSDHRPDLLTKLDALPSAPKLTEPEILERGRTFFTSIYSTVAPKLVGILTLLHPSLMPAIEAEYGAVLAETHTLNAFETELVMVAGLRVIGGEVEKQVESHRRGSRRHGATAEQVEAMVVLADVVAGRYMGVKESSL